MDTLANSEDTNEMPHNATFYQGLHCLLRQNRSSEKEKDIFWEIVKCDPSIYTIDQPVFIVCVCSFMENSIALKRVNK